MRSHNWLNGYHIMNDLERFYIQEVEDVEVRISDTSNQLIKWGFPKIGVPPVIILFFHRIFHNKNHPAIGVFYRSF